MYGGDAMLHNEHHAVLLRQSSPVKSILATTILKQYNVDHLEGIVTTGPLHDQGVN